MNFKQSGKVPDKLRLLAAALALAAALCGCQPQTSSSSGDPPPSDSSVFSSEPPPDTSESSETSQVSQVSTEDNTHAPETSEPPLTSDNSGDAESFESDPPESSEPISETSEESSSSSEETSTASSSEEPPVSSSEQSSSSSAAEPDPPPEIIIPDVKSPTSPGTQLITGANGAVDYSNASQGYISARYTGSSSKLKLRISANGGEYNHDLDPNGSTEYYPLEYGSGTYTVTMFEQLPNSTRYGEVAQGSFDVQLDSALSPFLYANRYVNFGQGSDVVYKSAELCAGKTSTIEKIAAVFTWVSENVSYDYDLAATVKSGYIPDPDRTLSRRTGICFDYASLIAAMLRSQSIPTRLVIGNAAPDIYHAWNEVYTEETGWITPELLLKNAGYNLVDATFYSSSSNKQQIADYISNGANYSALYYR
ncbi:MAG: transglutaminase-like domain-containing protein [Lachnospiraceae bacterium]|nr:transglutaminase-like domain-containing protein [Ruminococcus sp.]MCM1275139.1 transglutaminase-like domain-containing protein [Lachnospiraceae bacterium]